VADLGREAAARLRRVLPRRRRATAA
jgi:hypothetical protein